MPRRTVPPHVRQRRERRHMRLIALGYKNYPEYLRSSHWAAVRVRYRDSDLPQSCMCGEEEVDLHHKTYERVGAEELTDLVPLCRRCHVMVHELERRGVIKLDFAGFESLARAAEYAQTRADRNALTLKEWESVRLERNEEDRRARSHQRVLRRRQKEDLVKALRAAGFATKASRPDLRHATAADLETRSFDP